jgi:hypothetical protein
MNVNVLKVHDRNGVRRPGAAALCADKAPTLATTVRPATMVSSSVDARAHPLPLHLALLVPHLPI